MARELGNDMPILLMTAYDWPAIKGEAVDDSQRLSQWCDLCASQYATTKDSLGSAVAFEVLAKIFSIFDCRETEKTHLMVAEPSR